MVRPRKSSLSNVVGRGDCPHMLITELLLRQGAEDDVAPDKRTGPNGGANVRHSNHVETIWIERAILRH